MMALLMLPYFCFYQELIIGIGIFEVSLELVCVICVVLELI